MKPEKGAESELPSPGESRDLDSHAVPVFPIVGIGASAGGLEAFTQLLRHLPGQTGVAFVLIQHLAPQHESMLTGLLARSSAMPVTEVKDGMRVEPNHVYVIPPNADMAILNGVLHLMARGGAPAPSMPIDYFLKSLAADRREKAIGVILSGTASDGTLGVKAIKAEGGLTFAQEESSAKYPGMPQSAIAAGYVDFVLPPEGIARELARVGVHPYVTPSRTPTPAEAGEPEPERFKTEAEEDLSRVFILLRAATGGDFTHYKRTMVTRRVRRRMVLHNMESLGAYVRYLEEDRAEVNALYRDLLINVTEFFREPAVFESLQEIVFPRLLQDRPAEAPLRIWVPACSTGEEAYSVAICAVEYLSENHLGHQVQIFGTDISEASIAQARSGRYREGDVAGISAERLRRFFTPMAEGYQVMKSIRDLCVFARQNLIKDPPFSRLDLISCRNVLIYLDSTLQKRVLPTFHYALQSGGYLLLGSGENVAQLSDLFSAVDKKAKLYAKKPKPLATQLGVGVVDRGARRSDPEVVSINRDPRVELQKDLDRLLQAEYSLPGLVVNQDLEIVQFVGRVGPYLDPVAGAASFHLPKMTREGLPLELRAAVHRAQKEDVTVVKERLPVTLNGEPREVGLEVRPLKTLASGERYFLVIFRETPGNGEPATVAQEEDTKDAETRRLKQELAETKAELQDIIEEQEGTNEELRSANEEIQSSNEELQSTNEELETAKEELQATNEELTTVNEELQNRNLELTVSNDDLSNVISNAAVPMVVLGTDLRIRRFTPSAQKILNLIPADEGRPLADLRPGLEVPDLEQLIAAAIETGLLQEREVRDRQGRWHWLRIRPYRTGENKSEGAVLTLVDIDAFKSQVSESRQYAEAIVETVRESILMLDQELRVKAANRSFYETFQMSAGETESRFFYELREGQWDIPRLRELLEEVLPEKKELRDFVVEQDFPGLGTRTMLLNARQVVGVREGASLILLAIEDVTQQHQAQRVIARQATLLDLAQDAILVRSDDGIIQYWNRGAQRLYGWTREEVLGRSTHEILQTVFPVPFEEITDALRRDGHWEGDLKQVKRDGTPVIVTSQWTVEQDHRRGPTTWLEISRDITARREAERSLRLLSEQLLDLQEEERRRFARELHDGPAQTLSVIAFNLTILEQAQGRSDERTRKALVDAVRMTETAISELRTISYLMHPPVLVEQGLYKALQSYVKGFAERSGIETHLSVPPVLSSLRRMWKEPSFASCRKVSTTCTGTQRVPRRR